MSRVFASYVRLLTAVLAVAATLFFTPPLSAQTQAPGATLSGVITDESGAIVANVELTLAAPARGVQRRAISNAEGAFLFVGLPPGTYALLAVGQGFASQQIEDITLQNGDRRSLAVTMKVGPLAESVSVSAEGGAQVVRRGSIGFLGGRDFMDTPFNLTSYSEQLIQDQQARSIADVVNNDPSARSVHTKAQPYDFLIIRGFTARPESVSFGGLYGIAPVRLVDVETVDRVEVLKGPSALVYGMSPSGEVGGTVNVVPKRAGDEPMARVTALYNSRSQGGAHIDAGRRFGDDGRFGVRVNGVYRGGDTAVQPNSQQGGDAVIGFDARGDRMRFSLDAGYQRRDVEGMDSNSALKAGASLPDVPDASRSFLQPWTYFDTDSTFVMGRVDVSLSKAVGLSAAAGTSHNASDIVLSRASDLTANGDFVETFWGQSAANRNATADVALRVHATTGSVRHQIVANANALETDYDVLTRLDGSLTGGVVTARSNIYTPTLLPRPELPRLPDPPPASEATLTSVAVADTVSFRSDRLAVIAGARLQNVKSKTLDAASGAVTSRYDEQAVSPAIGIIVKPAKRVSLYGNYIEGLSQGPTAPTTATNAGQVFKPYKSAQYEGGVKLDAGTFAATASVFQISRPSGLIDPVSQRYDLDGEQRNRGVELNLFGAVRPGVRLLGGVMLLDPSLTKTANGAFNGNTAPGPAKLNINVGAEWDLPMLTGLTVSALGIGTGETYLDNANAQRVPGWFRADLGARYATRIGGRPVTFRLNVENVFNRSYWLSPYLYRAAPRTVLLSTTVGL